MKVAIKRLRKRAQLQMVSLGAVGLYIDFQILLISLTFHVRIVGLRIDFDVTRMSVGAPGWLPSFCSWIALKGGPR